MTELTKADLEEFIDRVPFSGCWFWTGALLAGYGQLTIRADERLAHRVSYKLYVGPIPTGLMVLHRCDVRCCVNPEHLYLGTHMENSRDMMLRNTSVHEPRLWTRRFSREVELEIVKLRDSGVKLRDIAKLYGCSLYLVWTIVSNPLDATRPSKPPVRRKPCDSSLSQANPEREIDDLEKGTNQ